MTANVSASWFQLRMSLGDWFCMSRKGMTGEVGGFTWR